MQDEITSSKEIMATINSTGMAGNMDEHTVEMLWGRGKFDTGRGGKTVVMDVKEVIVNTDKVYVEGGEQAMVVGKGIRQRILELEIMGGKSSLTDSSGRASTETGGGLSSSKSSISSSTPTSASGPHQG